MGNAQSGYPAVSSSCLEFDPCILSRLAYLRAGMFIYLTINIQFAGTLHSGVCFAGELAPGMGLGLFGNRLTRFCYSASVFSHTLALILGMLFLKFNYFEAGTCSHEGHLEAVK